MSKNDDNAINYYKEYMNDGNFELFQLRQWKLICIAYQGPIS